MSERNVSPNIPTGSTGPNANAQAPSPHLPAPLRPETKAKEAQAQAQAQLQTRTQAQTQMPIKISYAIQYEGNYKDAESYIQTVGGTFVHTIIYPPDQNPEEQLITLTENIKATIKNRMEGMDVAAKINKSSFIKHWKIIKEIPWQ